MRTRSMAPGAARWPQEICAPSKAGPVGDGAGEQPVRLPSTISALVPTSTISVISSLTMRRLRQDDAGGVGADMAGDAGQHEDPGIGMDAQVDLARPEVIAPSVASAKGAPPSSVGSMPSSRWCMIGLPTKVTSRIVGAAMPASLATLPARAR